MIDLTLTWITRGTILVAAAAAVLSLFRAKVTGSKLDEVHVLVNGRMTAVTARVEQLVAVLHEHGIEVPPDPASPVVVLAPLLPAPGQPGTSSPGS